MTPLLIAADNAQVFYTIRDFFNTFFETLIPISICVVLPIIVISMVMRARRPEVDKKTEVMLKAVESGAQLDPAFFQEINTRKEKTVKDRLMGYLTTACITSGIGVLVFYMEDKPVKEIAAILEMPSGSVRAYLSRGRQHVKNFLEKWKTR